VKSFLKINKLKKKKMLEIKTEGEKNDSRRKINE
jgi:hypothetical protein